MPPDPHPTPEPEERRPPPDFSPEAIVEALREATPGPWQAREGWNLMPPMRYEIAAPDVEEWSVVEAGDNDWGPAGGVNKKADAHLIANAPIWLAQLLAALERVTAERDSQSHRADYWCHVTADSARKLLTAEAALEAERAAHANALDEARAARENELVACEDRTTAEAALEASERDNERLREALERARPWVKLCIGLVYGETQQNALDARDAIDAALAPSTPPDLREDT